MMDHNLTGVDYYCAVASWGSIDVGDIIEVLNLIKLSEVKIQSSKHGIPMYFIKFYNEIVQIEASFES